MNRPQMRRLTSKAIVIDRANVDTDMIYPARFLLVTQEHGLGQYAFHDHPQLLGISADALRDMNGQVDRKILIAGENFGCGSSREHSVWCLKDLGIEALIAPSFGEIFYNNCIQNGILPIVIEYPMLQKAGLTSAIFTIDIEGRTLQTGFGEPVEFKILSSDREMLLSGWSQVELIQNRYQDAITQFEAHQRRRFEWLAL